MTLNTVTCTELVTSRATAHYYVMVWLEETQGSQCHLGPFVVVRQFTAATPQRSTLAGTQL